MLSAAAPMLLLSAHTHSRLVLLSLPRSAEDMMRLAAETSADSRSLLQQSQGGHAPRLRQHPEPHHPAHLIIPGVCT